MTAVVGGGVCCAAGLTRRQAGFVLRAGFPAISEAPLANADGEGIAMGYVPILDEAWTGEDRLAGLCAPPLQEALAAVGHVEVDVLVGIDRGLPDEETARAGITRLVRGVVPQLRELSIVATGDTLGPLWQDAVERLTQRRARAVIVGGVHSDYDPAAIAALEASGRLFARDNLDARLPGEAAAFVALGRGTPLARLAGWGRAPDPVRPDNDLPAYRAEGLTRAVRAATDAASAPAGWILNDLTGEMWRLYEWEAVFTRMRRRLAEPFYIESPAQRLGYLGAAVTPLMVAMAATGWEHGYAPSPAALLTAATDDGERAALVLHAP